MYEKYAALRDEHGLNDFKVAIETNIPKSTLSEWKSGKYTPKTDKIQKLAIFFNVPLSYFYE